MSDRRLTLTRDGNIIVIRGYKAAGIARNAGLRPTYSGSAGGWMIDASRLPELAAWLDYRNYRYEVVGEEPYAGADKRLEHDDYEAGAPVPGHNFDGATATPADEDQGVLFHDVDQAL